MGRQRKRGDEKRDADALKRIEVAKRNAGDVPVNPTSALAKIEGTSTNQTIIQSILKEREIARHADHRNVQTLYECLQMYLQHCHDNNLKITNTGAYAACGITKEMVYKWDSGLIHKDQPEYAEFARTVKSVCAEYREAAMATGEINPIIGIWWQKVYEGYRENEIVQQPQTNLLDGDTDSGTAQDIAERYDDLPD